MWLHFVPVLLSALVFRADAYELIDRWWQNSVEYFLSTSLASDCSMTWNEPERNILGAKLNQSRTFFLSLTIGRKPVRILQQRTSLWSRLYVSFMCSILSNENLLPLCLVSWSNSGFMHLHFRWSNLYFLLRQLTVGLKWSIVWLKVSFLIPSQLTVVTEFPLETRKKFVNRLEEALTLFTM